MVTPNQLSPALIEFMIQEMTTRLAAPQPTAQLPLATPESQPSATPRPTTVSTPTVNLTMECDDGMILIPDDDLEDEI